MDDVVTWSKDVITCRVRVGAWQQPLDMLDSCSCQKVIMTAVLSTMPAQCLYEKEVEVVFFHLINGRATDADVDAERAARGLLKDLYAQQAVNEANKKFAEKHSNAISWEGIGGAVCFLANVYDIDTGERYVIVNQRTSPYWFGTMMGGWWFAGVRELPKMEPKHSNAQDTTSGNDVCEETELMKGESSAELGLPHLEFKECTCNSQKHFVLHENNHPHHASFPLYTDWLADEQAEVYVSEGLLYQEDVAICRDWLKTEWDALNLPARVELGKKEEFELFKQKCTTARRFIPAYLIYI